jgi:hypothetical protein
VPPAKTTALAKPAGSSLAISSVDELMTLARILYAGRGSLLPNVDRPEKVFSILLAGLEVGLAPNQALDSIMMGRNGRLSIYGDGALALVRASGLLEKHVPETLVGQGEDRMGVCVIQRKGEPERSFTFSIREANAAGLIERAKGNKGDGPWITYQDRMLKMRARGFALRDVFPDVLRGLITHEEAADLDATPAPPGTSPPVVKQVDPPAITAGQPAGPVADVPDAETTPAGPPEGDGGGPLTEDQLKAVAEIQSRFFAGLNENDPAARKARWVGLLDGYGVKSAREFTQATAAKFISTEGPKVDPFRHPSTGSTT